MPAFKVGQKVVCIDDTKFDSRYGEIVPVKGRTYTVRSFLGECLRLKEITNTPRLYLTGVTECAFKASRFKPGKK